MFKNLLIFRIGAELPASAAALDEALQAGVFAPCSPTQATSSGWVPPRGNEHDPLVEDQAGHWVIRFQTEQRLLPTSVVADRVDEMVEQIEEQTGRKADSSYAWFCDFRDGRQDGNHKSNEFSARAVRLIPLVI